jgi:soluble lytic murein transglycosylase-like protein
VTQYLARRYRVADEAVGAWSRRPIAQARTQALDPLLILAVMAVESSMNPFAQSSVGAQGLMQVMTRVHADKFEAHGGDHAALDPIANIHVGSAILKDLVRRGGSVERGLQLYVGAGNLPDDGGYGSRVMAERARIQLAATGKVRWRAERRSAGGCRRGLRLRRDSCGGMQNRRRGAGFWRVHFASGGERQ